jgi:hypothetical protein
MCQNNIIQLNLTKTCPECSTLISNGIDMAPVILHLNREPYIYLKQNKHSIRMHKKEKKEFLYDPTKWDL